MCRCPRLATGTSKDRSVVTHSTYHTEPYGSENVHKLCSYCCIYLVKKLKKKKSSPLSEHGYVVLANEFIFLTSVYEGGQPVLSLAISSSRRQSAVSVGPTHHNLSWLGAQMEQKFVTKFLLWPGFEPRTF